MRSRCRYGLCCVLQEEALLSDPPLAPGTLTWEGLVCTALGSSRDPQQGLAQSGPSGQTLELPAAFQIPEGWSGALLLFGVTLLLITDCVGVFNRCKESGTVEEAGGASGNPGNNTGVGWHFLLQGILPSQRLILSFLWYPNVPCSTIYNS